MSESYYKPCAELDACNRLINTCFLTGQYEECFAGHLALAERGYPLARRKCDALGIRQED